MRMICTYGDNMSVIHKTQRLKSTLTKKINYICYPNVCESVAMVESLPGSIGTNKNCADLSTNVFYGGKRTFHVSNLLHDIYDDLCVFGCNY